MFQKITKHRANDASNDVHRPPLPPCNIVMNDDPPIRYCIGDHLVTTQWPLGDQLVTNWWPPFPSFSIIKSVSRSMKSTPMFKSKLNIFRSKGSIKAGGRGMRGSLEWTQSTKSDNFCYLSFTHFTGLKSWTNIMSATSFFRKSAKLQPTRILIGKFHTVCVRWNHQNFIRVWGIW